MMGSWRDGCKSRLTVPILTDWRTLEFGDSVIDLRAGDAATFQGTLPHRLRNAGRSPLRALSIITPPSF